LTLNQAMFAIAHLHVPAELDAYLSGCFNKEGIQYRAQDHFR